MGMLFPLVMLAVVALIIASLWICYTKAGKPGWAALVPFYNIWVLLEIVGRPGWWLILMLIPIVSLVVAIIVMIDLAKCFGKGAGFGLGLALLGFIFFPLLAFGDDTYRGPSAS